MGSEGQSFADIIADPGIGRIVIISLVTIPLTIIATVLRLISTKRAGRKLSWEDLFAVLALVGHLGYTVTPVGAIPGAADLSDEEASLLTAKLSYVATPFFYINQLFAKASLFMLYKRIFWSDLVFRRWIYGLAAIHIAWFITFFFMVLFLCNPVSKWWDITGTQPGTCIDGNTFLVAEETINSGVDLAMVGLAVAMVFKLQTRKLIKRKLTFIFIVGGLSGIIGFIKIGFAYTTPNDNGQENHVNAFWDILQMATSILCACVPMYPTIMPSPVFWQRIAQISSTWSRRSLLGSSNERSLNRSRDRKPSNPSSSRKDSERELDGYWSGLVRRPQASTNESDVELVETSRHFDRDQMV